MKRIQIKIMIIALLLVPVSSYCQISTSLYVGTESAPVVVSYFIDTPPEYGQPTIIRFELRITEHFLPTTPQCKWKISAIHNVSANQAPQVVSNVEWLEDSVFNWDAPHEQGDLYYGKIQFRPLSTGRTVLGLIIDNMNAPGAEWYPIQFCFDGNGHLTFLGEYKGGGEACSDSNQGVRITQPNTKLPAAGGWIYGSIFDYKIHIPKSPCIGDTSTIRVEAKFIDDFPAGFKFEVKGRAIDVIALPDNSSQQAYQGEITEYEFSFVPQAICIEEMLSIRFCSPSEEVKSTHSQTVNLFFVFEDSGELKLISTSHIFADEKTLPKSFRAPREDDVKCWSSQILEEDQE